MKEFRLTISVPIVIRFEDPRATLESAVHVATKCFVYPNKVVEVRSRALTGVTTAYQDGEAEVINA